MLKFKVYGTGKKKCKHEIQNNNSLLTLNLSVLYPRSELPLC